MLLLIANPILIAAAIIPAVVLLIQIYRADKLDKEPPSLILSLLLQGVIATALALFTERLGTRLLGLAATPDTVLYNVLMNFVVVGCSEEGFKYLLLRRRTWNSAAFNCQFDAVVYAVSVSLGFALWENIDYVIMYGFGTALVRAVTAVPGHACFGVFMGTFYGLAKRYELYGRMGESCLCRWLAFLVPVALHGCYDYIASFQTEQYAWIFVAFVVLLFLTASVLVRRLAKNDRYL